MAHRKLSDAERWQAVGMVRGDMSYIKTAERFNVSHSVIVRLKQRVNQTGSVKERQRTGKPLKKRHQKNMDSLKGSPDNGHSALQTRCEANGLSKGALADGPSPDVLPTQSFVLKRPLLTIRHETIRL